MKYEPGYACSTHLLASLFMTGLSCISCAASPQVIESPKLEPQSAALPAVAPKPSMPPPATDNAFATEAPGDPFPSSAPTASPAPLSATSPSVTVGVSRPSTIGFVPERVSNHYPIQSSGNSVQVERTKTGDYHLKFRAVAPRGVEESWAGYCWDINLVNAEPYETLKVTFANVAKPQELQFKLERQDSSIQDRVLRFPASPDTRIPLGSYLRVRHAVERFCLVLPAKRENGTLEADVTLSSVSIE